MAKSPINRKSLSGKDLTTTKSGDSISKHEQLVFIEVEKTIDGIVMGVMSDGTPFLNGRGLAKLCNVNNARIVEMGQAWDTESTNAMAEKVKEILRERGVMPEVPFIQGVRKGRMENRYSDDVCLAVLEYYAFDQANPHAIKNFRRLSGKALRDFVYKQVGYSPGTKPLDLRWRPYLDRVSLTHNALPAGFFCVFKEMAEMFVFLGENDLVTDNKFIPDISVGQHWSKHWERNAFDKKHGERLKYEHNYPEYFPQAESNPQSPWCYPDSGLADFRKWMREDYVGSGKFEKYLDGQVAKGAITAGFAQGVIAAYKSASPKALPK